VFTDSSAELINWVLSHDDACHTHDERIHHNMARVAVFTQMNDEGHLREEQSDIIKIEGIHVPLKTNWEIVPIILMDSGHHIQCAGIMFAAFDTTEVILWLIGILLETCSS
jgi:hypothetical protein